MPERSPLGGHGVSPRREPAVSVGLWLPRLLSTLFVVSLGGWLGHLIGQWLAGRGSLGAWIGAMGAVGLLQVRDAIAGETLLRWLKRPQGEAPRSAGLWAELGYRVERELRYRDRRTGEESARLQQFLSAIEASPNGVMMLDADERILWCNAVAAQHFAIDSTRDHEQRITNLVRAPVFVAYLQGTQHDAPVTFLAPDSESTLSVLVRPYGDGQILVLSRDVTEHLRNEAMRRDFVANVSHEIRTPLTVLAGFVESLQQLALTEPERQRVLKLMTQQTQRMQRLVDDLLTLARLEGSPRPGAQHWVPVSRLVDRVAAEGRSLSGGRHALTLQAPAGNWEIAGNEAELVSGLQNLVGNAVRYTPDGGHVEILVERDVLGRVRLSVRDDGPGIAAEHLPRLTERFYRVDSSRSRETGGTGLGLAIVKHVMQRHGGELQVDSQPGEGSTFSLVFPSDRTREVGGGGEALAAVALAQDGDRR